MTILSVLTDIETPEALDFDGGDPATGVALDRETPEGERSAWFDRARVPAEAAHLERVAAALRAALEGWRPGAPVPPGLVSIRRRGDD